MAAAYNSGMHAAGIWIGLYVNRTYRLQRRREKFSHVLELIKDEYVEDIDVDSLIEMTMPNLLTNLDPHTVYIPASELKEVNSDLDGSFSGIGIFVYNVYRYNNR